MRCRPLLASVLASSVALLSSGCITATNVVKLKPNGSGTLETTVLVNTAVFEQLGAMMGGEVKSKGSSSPMKDMMSEEEIQKQLSTMKGVRLVSRTPIKEGTSEGARIVMAFDDVNQIAVSEDLPAGGKKKPTDEVKFAMTKQPNGNALLSISFPDKPGEAAKKAGAEPKAAPSDMKPSPEMMKMVAAMFKGMRVMIAVDVDGTLVRTSSPYVEGNRVTLLDIDMDRLLEDPNALQKLEAFPLGPDMSITQAREAMAKAGVKGIKVNDPRITIEMR